MRRLLTLALAVGLTAGCTDRVPTTPGIDPPGFPQAPDPSIPQSPDRQAAVEGIHDAIARIVPAIPTPDARSELHATLSGLADRLTVANSSGLHGSFEAVRSVIDRYRTDGEYAADLDAIDLALDFAASTFRD